MKHVRSTIAILIVLIALALLPQVIDNYLLRIFTTVFMFCGLAQALNILYGLTGYPALGNLVFFGMGAYTTAILMRTAGLSFATSLVLAALIPGVVAFAMGMGTTRLRGSYFLMATVALNELAKQIISTWLQPVSGGGKGLTLPIPPWDPTTTYRYFYFMMLGIAVAATIIFYLIRRSRLGYGARAIRADEDAALSLGVPTDRYKSILWSISAALTGLIGGIDAYWIGYIDPPSTFSILISVEVFLMLLLGGAGTISGPIIGAAALTLISELVWAEAMDVHTGVLGALVVAIILLLPRGILGHTPQIWRYFRVLPAISRRG